MNNGLGSITVHRIESNQSLTKEYDACRLRGRRAQRTLEPAIGVRTPLLSKLKPLMFDAKLFDVSPTFGYINEIVARRSRLTVGHPMA